MSQTTIELVPVTYPASIAQVTPNSTRFSLSTRELPRDEQLIVPEQTIVETEQATKGETFVVITSVTCITGISSLLAGVVTVTLPTMARELRLESNLLLWPSSIYALTCGCTLLLSGAVADVVGARPMYLFGCILQSALTLACGLSRTGTQLILFRGLAGIAISFCLPSAVSIITGTFPPGKRRNIAFASMGGGQPIGFSLGLTLGGVFTDSIGWRWGFHIATMINTIIFIIAVWGLPRNLHRVGPITWQRLTTDIDWVGAFIASACLGMLSYVFASITGNTSHISDQSTIVLLSTAIALIPTFIVWINRQSKSSRPAIIPPSLWRNKVFSSICLSVFLTWGAFNALEQILTFYFQYIQSLSAIKTSLLFLPAPIMGAVTNFTVGLIVHRVQADHAVLATMALSSLAPLLMAIAKVDEPYWSFAFPAVTLNPVGADTLFTVSNLLITSVFPARTQALAGGVFNTVAQVGKSVGLATSAVIASSVTTRLGGQPVPGEYGSNAVDYKRPLMEGYRAAFWYCFALEIATLAIGMWGLRKIGKVGVKRE